MRPVKTWFLALVGTFMMLSGCTSSAIPDAASSGDLGQLKSYIEGGGDIEGRGEKNWVSGLYYYGGNTPLHMAVAGNRPQAVRYLLDQGADIEAKNSDGKTPLLLSAETGNIAIYDRLQARGAKTHITDKNGNTAVLLALQSLKDEHEKAFKTVQALIDRHADFSTGNRWQQTPLHLAAEYKLTAVTRLLVHQGADIQAINNKGESPLFSSLSGGYFTYHSPDYEFQRSETFEYLVTLEQNYSLKNHRGQTLLHRVCNPDYIDLLLDKKVSETERDKEGQTPPFFAIEHCPVESVLSYINHGFDIQSVGVDGKTVPLAALNNVFFRKEMLAFVIDQGADVTQPDSLGGVTLHRAAAHSPQILDLVINHGGDINVRTKTGATPLHVAASINPYKLIYPDRADRHRLNTEAYRHLLGKPGVLLNAKDIKGCTPLHRAVNSDSLEKIKLLLEHGADFSVKENRGHTPMDMAVLRKNKQMIDLFKQYGAVSSVDTAASYRVLCAYP